MKYKTITIRISEKTRENLKNEKVKSGLSWNLFLVKLLNTYKPDQYGFNQLQNKKAD